MLRKLWTASLIFCVIGGTAFSQTTTENSGQLTDPDTADISFSAQVEANELRFDEKPKGHIRFNGFNTSGWQTVRTNFPKEVVPGQIYKNIKVDFKLTDLIKEQAVEQSQPQAAPPSQTPDGAVAP